MKKALFFCFLCAILLPSILSGSSFDEEKGAGGKTFSISTDSETHSTPSDSIVDDDMCYDCSDELENDDPTSEICPCSSWRFCTELCFFDQKTKNEQDACFLDCDQFYLESFETEQSLSSCSCGVCTSECKNACFLK